MLSTDIVEKRDLPDGELGYPDFVRDDMSLLAQRDPAL
jgi:hypothetical protein